MSRLLVVEQGAPGFRRYILERLVQLGYRLTLLTAFPTIWGRELFTDVLESRLTSWPRIEQLATAEHARDPFAGIFCYNEGGVPTANAIAALLNLPRVSAHDADAFRHKDRMRIAWEACSIPIPRYRILYRPYDMYHLKTWKFPLILKPAGLMGSNGVIKVDRFEDLPLKIHIPFNADLDLIFDGEVFKLSEVYGLPNTVLAEEYISGPEYSAEGLVVGGSYYLLGITKKFTVDEPYFDEVGHIFPACDIDAATYAEIERQLVQAHRALGLQNAFTHGEFRLAERGPVFMELGARMGGDHIPRLVDHALMTDTVDLAARVATSRLDPTELIRIRHTPHNPPGRVTAILFLSAPKAAYGCTFKELAAPQLPGCEVVESAVYLHPGDLIQPPETWGDTRIGHVMFTAPHFDTIRTAMLRSLEQGGLLSYE